MFNIKPSLQEIKEKLAGKNGKFLVPVWTEIIADLETPVSAYNKVCKDKKYGLMAYFIRGHQWMYDKKSLQSILKKNGFSKVVECKFRRGECPDIERLDYEGHKKISMYLEAQ